MSHYGSYASKNLCKKLSSLFLKLFKVVDEIMSLGSLFHSLTIRLLKNISRCVILVN